MIHLGDCVGVLKSFKENSIDACVTDCPYGLSFMGKKWDYDVPSVALWQQVFRVLKPGAHLLSFGGTRTYHRMVVNIEDAGFEIRDQIQWLYGSGFPKSHNVSKGIDKAAGAEREVVGKLPNPSSTKNRLTMGRPKTSGSGFNKSPDLTAPSTPEAKQWDGWGTALKPANEPIVLARKPLSEKTVAKNVLKWGTGALNIDACRVETEDKVDSRMGHSGFSVKDNKVNRPLVTQTQGRWPANVIFSHSQYCTDDQCDLECAIKMLDEQSGEGGSSLRRSNTTNNKDGQSIFYKKGWVHKEKGYHGSGGASRFFYCAKASKSERNKGLDSSDLIWESESWEKLDLSLLTENINQLSKDISGDTSTDDKSWSTDLYGHSISEQYPPGMMSTIKTVIKLITELRTLNSSQSLSTKDIIQDAIRTIEVDGLSLAESAVFINQLDLSTIKEKTASLLGAVRAVLPMLLKIRESARSGNFHSTVKPIRLMEYLIKLVSPPGSIVLDPFMGSGSTGVACKNLGVEFIGIEREAEYVKIAEKRIEKKGPAPA